MYLLKISKDYPKLAQEEAKALLNFKGKQAKEFLIGKLKTTNIQRIAFTKEISQILFITNKKNLYKDIEKFNFQKIYEKNFAIRFANNTNLEKKIASIIWYKLKNPKVNLKKPKTLIKFYKINNKIYCTLNLFINKEKFSQRKSQKRKYPSATTLNPKLARAMVNLSKAKSITDFFCGSGGILIEAGLMNLKTTGIDLNKKELEACKENLKQYKIKNFKLVHVESSKLQLKSEAIVSDLPYGKNSKLFGEIKEIYKNFINNSYKNLNKNKRLIIMTKNNLKTNNLINKTLKNKFRKVNIINIYIHKSLTRKLWILEKL